MDSEEAEYQTILQAIEVIEIESMHAFLQMYQEVAEPTIL
jgi:hypothetical protein